MPTTSEVDPFLPFLNALSRLGSAEFSGQHEADRQALALHAEFLRMREMVSRIRMAGEMKMLLRGCASVADTAPILEMELGRLFKGATGGIYLLSPSSDQMNVVAEWPAEGASREGFLPADCRGYRLGRPYCFGPGLEALRCRHADRSTDGPTLCIPLGGPHQQSGVLHLAFDAETETVLPESDLGQFASQVADDLDLALSLLHLGEQLRRRAVIDPLTGRDFAVILPDCSAENAGKRVAPPPEARTP